MNCVNHYVLYNYLGKLQGPFISSTFKINVVILTVNIIDRYSVCNTKHYHMLHCFSPHVPIWLSLSDRAEEGVWRWLEDNSLAVWTDWYWGQPSNLANEDCAMIWSGYKWFDLWCENPTGHQPNYICYHDRG